MKLLPCLLFRTCRIAIAVAPEIEEAEEVYQRETNEVTPSLPLLVPYLNPTKP
jgi:hypothetical protein